MPKSSPKNWQAWLRIAALGALLAGALGWLVGRFVFEGHEGWGDWALNIQFWSLKVHGAGAMLSLVALGLALEALLPALKDRKQRLKLGSLTAMAGLLILSGWLIYYGPSGELHDWISLGHWGLGLLTVFTAASYNFYGRGAVPRRGARRKR